MSKQDKANKGFQSGFGSATGKPIQASKQFDRSSQRKRDVPKVIPIGYPVSSAEMEKLKDEASHPHDVGEQAQIDNSECKEEN